jgi:uncharacterized protein
VILIETVVDFPLKDFVFNRFRFKKYLGNYLVIGNDGGSIFLTENEFKDMLEKRIIHGSELYNKLINSRIIIDGSNLGQLEKGIINRYHFIKGYPTLNIVVISNRCTHKCVYCHAASAQAAKEEFDLSLENAKKTCDTILSNPSKNILIEFQGGEPLINFEAIQFIVEYARKNANGKKINFALVTNLELMDDLKFEYLIKNNISICTSLDGNEEVHNFNRKSENKEFNSFLNIVKWIEKIKKVQKPAALVTVTKKGIENYKEIIDTYIKLGFESIFLRPLHFLGTAKSTISSIGYTGSEFIEFYKKSLNYIIEKNKQGIKLVEMNALYKMHKITDRPDPCLSELMSPSGSCIGQIAYNHDGRVFSCDDGRNESSSDGFFQIGVAGEDINTILSRDKVKLIVESSINDKYDCDLCVYKPFCGFSTPQNYGKLNTIVPINIEDSRCKIAMGEFDFLFEKMKNNKEDWNVLYSWIN